MPAAVGGSSTNPSKAGGAAGGSSTNSLKAGAENPELAIVGEFLILTGMQTESDCEC